LGSLPLATLEAIMIPPVFLAFFGTLAGKVAFWGGVSTIALGVYWWNAMSHQNRGVMKERASVEEKGKKIDARASSARRDAERRAPDSLREYVRD
jgi:hypothetical protein